LLLLLLIIIINIIVVFVYPETLLSCFLPFFLNSVIWIGFLNRIVMQVTTGAVPFCIKIEMQLLCICTWPLT